MTNTRLPLLAAMLLFCGLFSDIFCQDGPPKFLTGRVVAIRDGAAVGIPDVKVAIREYDSDITDKEGNFRLPLPPDRDFISIELTNTVAQMISPYSGIVNLPPGEDFQVLVCEQKNQRLLEQVEQLNKRIRGHEKERQLNARQLAAMHRVLLDTVIHFEHIMLEKEAKIAEIEKENGEMTEELRQKKDEIAELRQSVKRLMDQLADALEEKYLRQKKVFDEVSATLNDYADKAKNLRDNLHPDLIAGYFLPQNEPMRQHLYQKEEQYNAAYAQVVGLEQAHIEAVGHYWEKAALAHGAIDTYAFLLKELHGKGIYPLDTSVNGNLRRWIIKDLSRGKASKAAEEAVGESAARLDSQIAEFEKMKDDLILNLKLGF